MWKMLQLESPEDFIICSGRSIYLRDIIYYCFDKFKIDHNRLKVNPEYYRPEEIMDMFGDNNKAKTVLGWNYELKFEDVIDSLIEQELENLS
jgi:GDPmannose 4,6-dehydratase